MCVFFLWFAHSCGHDSIPYIVFLLQVLEAVLVEASSMPAASYTEFVETCGTLEDIHLLLNYVATSSRTNAQVGKMCSLYDLHIVIIYIYI